MPAGPIKPATRDDQVKMILRASPSGSFTMRHSLSQIMVVLVSGSVGAHFKPDMLGFPVAANAAQDAAIFFARRLRLRGISRSLFAPLGIVEAELKIGCVPGASYAVENRRLPGEVVGIGRSGLQFMLQPRHLHYVVAHAESPFRPGRPLHMYDKV